MNEIITKVIEMPLYFSAEASDLISKLLEKSPNNRIGCGKEGADEIKRHAFFKDIDWEKLLAKELIPPFIPNTTSAYDT